MSSRRDGPSTGGWGGRRRGRRAQDAAGRSSGGTPSNRAGGAGSSGAGSPQTPRRGGTRDRRDPVVDARRAGAQDRDERLYDRKRARQARQRAAQDRERYDPSPPTDDDWTVPEEGTDGIQRISPPEPIGAALDRFVERRGWDERLRGANAWSSWSGIVGAELADRCEPVRLAGGTLVVRASSHAWATQLRYLSGQLRANAERLLGPGTVTQVRIVVGPLEGRTEPE